MSSDLRERKRLALRESLSDLATAMFMERGFDQVTVDDIAAAADVGRKTVFNHFPRKEDLFFDRDGEIREVLKDVLPERGQMLAPVEAYRLLAHRLVAGRSAYVAFTAQSRRFVETVEASPALTARARELASEIAQDLALALAAWAQVDAGDPDAYLAAHLLVATWTAARMHGHRVYVATSSAKKAQAAFLRMVDQGSAGVQAAMAGSPYA